VEVRSVTAKEHANACGLIFDLVEQQGLRHLGSGELAAAVKAATRRPLGDAWAWSRKGGVDISPLVAATLAQWGSATLHRAEPDADGGRWWRSYRARVRRCSYGRVASARVPGRPLDAGALLVGVA
jgi:hypothetical protein